MNLFNKILQILGSKYFLTFLAFAFWMVFFDNNSMLRQHEMAEQLRELKHEKAFYVEEIEKNRKTAEALQNDTELLEKYARERYLMKRDNEDIYLIVYDDEGRLEN